VGIFSKEWDCFFGINNDRANSDSVKTTICHGTGKINASTSPHGIKQGTVPGEAIASSCRVIMSCFPILGGLHHSSNDASVSTTDLLFLQQWCHVYKSNTPSFMQRCVAALAYIAKGSVSSKKSISHWRFLNQCRKLSKQQVSERNKDCMHSFLC
jgi:hypothetical protein